MRRSIPLYALTLAALLAGSSAFADSSSSKSASSDPVVASVNGMKIYMSDIQRDAQSLPPQAQQLPPDKLYPLLVNQEIDRKALLIAAKKQGLDKKPEVIKAMQHAANMQLENAYVQEHVAPAVTATQVQAAYNRDYAGKPGPEQVEARHILVKTKAEAEKIIDELNHGANFAKLADKDSIDPGAKNGGQLGWFSKDEMVPAFADAAFALKPGEYTKTPVQTQFGWHVILCEGKRQGPTPKLSDVEDQIKQQLADAAIQKTLDDVRGQVKIVTYDDKGKPTKQPSATKK